MTAILRLRHEVKGGYKGCCRCPKRFLPYYVGSDGHWYCEDCGQELVKKKKTATFGVLGDPDFKFDFNHPRCLTSPTTEPAQSEGKIKLKLDTSESKERWEHIKLASAEVTNWPPELRVEAGKTCPCPTECGHPVESHQMIKTVKTVCRDCPPAESVEDRAKKFIDRVYERDGEGLLDAGELVEFVESEIERQTPAIIEKAFAEGRKSVVFEPHATYRGNLRELVVEGDFDFTKIFGEFEYEGEKYAELSEDGADAITDYILGLMEQVDEIRSEDAERYQNPQTVKARRSGGEEKDG